MWRAGLAAIVFSLATAGVASAEPRVSPGDGAVVQPWVEGVDPILENRLFYATYGALQTHNVLKVYVFSADGYETAGIRFSGRVPHAQRDLTVEELSREAVILVRTTFDDFPQVQQLDVWATIPIAPSEQTSEESTVFSVSALRSVYDHVSVRTDVTDLGFLNAFGRVWIAPQVPR
ncbi:MAG TPA: hypothetical protein VEJ20_09700 [Candidatus Eremiobacteraceae bacterium]|nr:hypothetical protein [Candidatus Eremiobacteraceae bacterium]